jgi:hypothetical protein
MVAAHCREAVNEGDSANLVSHSRGCRPRRPRSKGRWKERPSYEQLSNAATMAGSTQMQSAFLIRHGEDGAWGGDAAQGMGSERNQRRGGLRGERARDKDGAVERPA